MSVRGLANEVLDLLFPPRCQVCGELSADPFCATCLQAVEFIAPPACLFCGAPIRPTWPAAQLCADCREGRALSGARSAGLHAGPLREAIIRYKFDGRTRLAAPLAAMLVEVVRTEIETVGLPLGECAALVPVPLHPGRRSWRGFDQAEMLCAAMADEVGLPVWTDVIARIRNTTPQVHLRGLSRRENVRGAFAARRRWKLRGVALILVDDVFTTGATMSECAQVLREAGAVAVYGLTVSRAIPSWTPAGLISDRDDAPSAAR